MIFFETQTTVGFSVPRLREDIVRVFLAFFWLERADLALLGVFGWKMFYAHPM
jgi:hypothetical protein